MYEGLIQRPCRVNVIQDFLVASNLPYSWLLECIETVTVPMSVISGEKLVWCSLLVYFHYSGTTDRDPC